MRLVNTSSNVFSVDISQRLKRIEECKQQYAKRLTEMGFGQNQISAVLDAYQRDLPSFSDVLSLVMQQPQIQPLDKSVFIPDDANVPQSTRPTPTKL